MVQINLDVAEEQNYAPLPEGEYAVTVERCEENISKNGNTFFEFTLTVNGKNRKVWDRLTFTANTASRVKKVNSCFGLATTGSVDVSPNDYIGKSCIAKLFIEDYTNKDGVAKQRNVVDWWNSKKLEINTNEQIPF